MRRRCDEHRRRRRCCGRRPADQDDAVRYELTDSGVAVLTLNRPQRLNTWGADIAGPFYSSLERADDDPAVRVLVVTGSGKAFCAGAQLGSMETVGKSLENTDERTLSELVGERQPHFLTTLRKPVIAAVNGSCVGIGLTLALMCDVRFAAAGRSSPHRSRAGASLRSTVSRGSFRG
ncbi:enoyl-CoA hydratase [Mycobacterium xenopi 3993]|nr:enoyl-CoA hydratase [Mycobacterium xenopi 3993]